MHLWTSVVGMPRIATHRWLLAFISIALCLTILTACGFRLKGVAPLPFETLYTNIAENSAFGANMRRAIVASSPHTRFVNDPQEAEARLMQLTNRQIRRELSIDAEGHVEEYELNLEFVFQLTDSQGRIVLPPTSLRATREMPYDSEDSQAKQAEIRMIFQDMQQSMIARVVRHLSSPDVTEAFQQAQTQPAPEEGDASLDTSDLLSTEPGIVVDEWESEPDATQPFN